MQKTIIEGRVGFVEATNPKVFKFTIGVSENYTDKSGNKIEHTEWFNCAIFDEKRIEYAKKLIQKGMLIVADTKRKTSEYMKDNEKRYSYDYIVNEYRTYQTVSRGDNSSSSTTTTSVDNAPKEDDDLPF